MYDIIYYIIYDIISHETHLPDCSFPEAVACHVEWIYIWLPWRDIQAGRLEKMHVQALLSSKMMVCNAVCSTSISSFALHLHIIYDIIQ